MKRPARQEICHGYKRLRAASASDAARRKLFFAPVYPVARKIFAPEVLAALCNAAFAAHGSGRPFLFSRFQRPENAQLSSHSFAGHSIHVFIPASAVPSPSRSRIVFPADASAPSTSRGGRVFPSAAAAVPQVLLSRIIPSQYRPPLYIARHTPPFTFPLRRFQGFSFKSGRLRPYCAGRGASQFAVATVGPSSSNHFLIRTGCALNIARHTPPFTFPLRRFRGFSSKSSRGRSYCAGRGGQSNVLHDLGHAHCAGAQLSSPMLQCRREACLYCAGTQLES